MDAATWSIVAGVAGNAAFGLNALAFWMKDVRRLRWVSIASSACFVVYSATAAEHPLWLMIAWSTGFAAINAYRLAARRPHKAAVPASLQ